MSIISELAVIVIAAVGCACIGAGVAAGVATTITALPIVLGALAGVSVGLSMAAIGLEVAELVKYKFFKSVSKAQHNQLSWISTYYGKKSLNSCLDLINKSCKKVLELVDEGCNEDSIKLKLPISLINYQLKLFLVHFSIRIDDESKNNLSALYAKILEVKETFQDENIITKDSWENFISNLENIIKKHELKNLIKLDSIQLNKINS